MTFDEVRFEEVNVSGVIPEIQDLVSQVEVVLTRMARTPLDTSENFKKAEQLSMLAGNIQDEIKSYGYLVEGDLWPPLDGRERWKPRVVLKTINPETATPEEIRLFNWWFAGFNGLPDLSE